MWDLLGTALRLIPPVTVQYQKYIGETVNELGICVPQYADPVTVSNAHLQPSASSTGFGGKFSGNNVMYDDIGLQLAHNFRMLYIPANIQGIEAQTTNDVILYGGKRWNIKSVSQWFDYDGWNKLIIVEDKKYGADK